jgi:hypothetical protein
MKDQSPSGQSSASRYKQLNMPTADQRQAACTHLNVTRLFDPLDSYKCQMCGRSSSFGWLYRCTQDYSSFLPESDFSSEEPENFDGRLSEQVVTSRLSQSVLKGIENGQYTAQQIRLLQAQKRRVKEFIAIQEERLENLSDSSQTSSSFSTSDSALDDSVFIATDTSASLQDQSANICNQIPIKPTADREKAHPLMLSAPKKIYIEPLVPNCHFKCCHNCRPAYRDRAFQSLNAILAEPLKEPPQWELANRRISDVDLLRRIATRSPRPQLRRMYETFDDLRDLRGSQTIGSSENEEADSGVNSMKKKVRRRSGFRETVRKALSAIDHPRYAAKSSKHSSRSSSRDSLIQMSRSMLFRRRGNQAQEENQIVSNRALQESLVLMLAVNTPLPRALEDSDSLDGGEVRVEDGVAVTEEGVEMSAADIIIQG